MQITVTKNGPYMVSGNVPLVIGEIVADTNGDSLDLKEVRTIDTAETYALCRCGQSANKPFCDGAHTKAGFDGTCTAPHDSFDAVAQRYPGPAATLLDAKEFCINARFCDRGLNAWVYTEKSDVAENLTEAKREVGLCPSGRLVLLENDTPVEPSYEPSIMVLEDPNRECGSAYFVRGGIEIIDEDGVAYEVRNRMTLCRCGQSKNKPFCDATHYACKFSDGLAL